MLPSVPDTLGTSMFLMWVSKVSLGPWNAPLNIDVQLSSGVGSLESL